MRWKTREGAPRPPEAVRFDSGPRDDSGPLGRTVFVPARHRRIPRVRAGVSSPSRQLGLHWQVQAGRWEHRQIVPQVPRQQEVLADEFATVWPIRFRLSAYRNRYRMR